ncbi:MAG: site-specific integrase [Sulfurimonas sp.]|jgi:integrase
MESTEQAGVYFRLNKNNDKIYYIKYLDENKKQKLVKVGNHTAGIRIAYCSNLRNDILSKIRLGENLPFLAKNKTLKFNDLAETYYENIKLQSGYKAMLGKYNKVIKPFLGHKSVNSINESELKNFVKYLNEKGYANKTIMLYYSQVKTIFNYNKSILKFKGEVPHIHKFKISIDNTRESYLSKNEVNDLLLLLSKNDSIAYVFTVLSLNLGARAESINNLKVGDINFSDNTIKIYDFKRKMTYTNYLNKFLLDFLIEYIKDNELSRTMFIISKSITKMSYSTIRHKLVPHLNELFNKDLDINDRKKRVVVHTLRHTFASNLVINGVSIYVVQKLLNHSDIKMTLRYAKLEPENFINSVDKLYM